MNRRPQQYDYYGDNCHHNHVNPCPPPLPNPVVSAPIWDRSIAEHNEDKNAHQYILNLLKDAGGLFLCKDTIAERDLIPEGVREIGMLCYVVEKDVLYQLKTSLDNEGWVNTNINSDQYIKLGRFNAPEKPETGLVYFDLNENRLKTFFEGKWHLIPTQEELKRSILAHDLDEQAHAAKFKDVENSWLSI